MKLLLKLAAICGLAAACVTSALAGPAPDKGPKCPACHMVLSAHKSKATPIAVRLKKGGKIYYCCAGCVKNMPKGMVVKGK